VLEGAVGLGIGLGLLAGGPLTWTIGFILLSSTLAVSGGAWELATESSRTAQEEERVHGGLQALTLTFSTPFAAGAGATLAGLDLAVGGDAEEAFSMGTGAGEFVAGVEGGIGLVRGGYTLARGGFGLAGGWWAARTEARVALGLSEETGEMIAGAANISNRGPTGVSETFPWRLNESGRRTEIEALEIARREGIVIPEDIKLWVDPGLDAARWRNLENPRIWARYGGRLRQGSRNMNNLVEWEELLVTSPLTGEGRLPIAIRPEVLYSDEAIVATLGHEMYEVSHWRQRFANANVTLEEFDSANKGWLHNRAVVEGDRLVFNIRRRLGL